jgi:hypothetical protein
VCLLLAAGLIACAGASAGNAMAAAPEGSSLQQLAEQEGQTETATTATTSTSSSSSSESNNSHTTILLAMAAAVVLLSGIAFVIVRDARRVAPATETEVAEARGGRNDAVMLRKRRARARAARQQRKRNR